MLFIGLSAGEAVKSQASKEQKDALEIS